MLLVLLLPMRTQRSLQVSMELLPPLLLVLPLPVQQPPQQVLLVVPLLFWDSVLRESLLGLLLPV